MNTRSKIAPPTAPAVDPATRGAPPPRSAGERFGALWRRYGFAHALAASIGRYNAPFWSCAGPIVSRSYVRRYIELHSPRMLNLGAGSMIIEGMLNVDISPRSDAFVNLLGRYPFDDGTFEYIYSEEVIEHFDEVASMHVLEEAYRILVPGGVARFTTPRLEWFVDRFHEKDQYGTDFNRIFYGHGHKHIYTEKSLRAAMEKAGFCEIRFTGYRDSASPLGLYDSHADRYGDDPMMSLYVEGAKSC